MPGGRSLWYRLPLVAALCLLLLWVLVGTTLNMVLAQSAPAAALRWWPMGAEAKTGLAARQLVPGASRTAIVQAQTLAAQALVREPALGPAASVLGLAKTMAGDLAGADRVFAYAERTSRRDLSTQTWLIERRVGQGDVAGALAHYDVALRTNRAAYDALLPVLAAASANAPVARALLPYLAHRAAWSGAYIQQLVSAGDSPDAMAVQLRAMKLDPVRDDERVLLAKAVQRLVALDRPDLGYRLIGTPGTAMLRDGNFDQPGSFPPFDWWLRDDPDLAASREARDGSGGYALHVTATGERGGEVAHQLLLLPAGRFRLGGIIRGSSSGNAASDLLFSLSCARRGTGLVTARIAASAGGGTLATIFNVPPDCPAQWLRIATPPATNVDAWVDRVSVTRISATVSIRRR